MQTNSASNSKPTVSPKQWFKCDECDRNFNDKLNADYHKLVDHLRAKSTLVIHKGTYDEVHKVGSCYKSFKCSDKYCGHSFTSEMGLKSHVIAAHSPLVCDYEGCGQTFKDIGLFYNHKRIHKL